MSTRIRQKQERLEYILEKLTEANQTIPIIVEGKKDEETLRQLSITGTIINAKKGGQSLYTLTQAIIAKHPREVILLLDFDRRGKEATNYLKTQLERARIIPNLKYWAQIERTVGKEVKDIEGLASYMETLKRKLYH